MSRAEDEANLNVGDTAPGGMHAGGAGVMQSILGYVIGFGLAILLTVASFYMAQTTLVYGPSIPVGLVVLAIAQIGVHLVFFLHITTAPDHTNNILALAFGVLIVALLLCGSIWIMANLNQNMLPIEQIMQMQR
jgi:cytochrome o ubiquinol oxidase subunit IV